MAFINFHLVKQTLCSIKSTKTTLLFFSFVWSRSGHCEIAWLFLVSNFNTSEPIMTGIIGLDADIAGNIVVNSTDWSFKDFPNVKLGAAGKLIKHTSQGC